MSYDQSKNYDALNSRLNRYVQSVIGVLDALNLEGAKLALSTGHDGTEAFRFADYPITKARVEELRKRYIEDIRGVVYASIDNEWKNSNIAQDLLADEILTSQLHKQKGKEAYTRYYEVNSEQLKAFKQRTQKGMNLSQRLWNQSSDYMEEMEAAIGTAINRGTDAVTLSKQVSKYLRDFDTLKADYTEKFGHATDVKDCEYRSIRLARSEINMAYRKAESLRWNQFDFVIGKRIQVSRNGEDRRAKNPHEADICDELAGDYPKYIDWDGWHPNCRCFATPILMKEEDFLKHERGEEVVGTITEVPNCFKEWVRKNQNRILAAEKSNTLPYFLSNNKDVYSKWLGFNYANYEKNIAYLKRESEYEDYLKVRTKAKYFGVDIKKLEDFLLYGDTATGVHYSILFDIDNEIAKKMAEAEKLISRIVPLVNYMERAQLSFPYLGLSVNKDVELFVRTHRMTEKQILSQTGTFPFDHAKVLASLTEERIERAGKYIRKTCDKELARRIGVSDKLKPMSFNMADELRGNPLYGTPITDYDYSRLSIYQGSPEHPYRINCTACCVTNEARRRGMDVEAYGNFIGSRVESLMHKWYRAYIDPSTMKMATPRLYVFTERKKDAYRMYEELKEQMKTPGRYVVNWRWEKGGGHVSCFETTKRGVFRSIDAQNGSRSVHTVMQYLSSIEEPSYVRILRIDDKILDPEFCEEIVKKKQ